MSRTDISATPSAQQAARQRQGALLLNWFDIEPGREGVFDDWHNREHVIERMGVPGFMQGRRFEADGAQRAPGHGWLVAYDATDLSVFESPAYAARLDAPTPLTARVVPYLRSLTRTVYRVEKRHGAGVSAHVRTVRLHAAEGSPPDASSLRDTIDQIYTVSSVSAVILASPDARVTHFKDRTKEGQATETLARNDYPWIVLIEACRREALDEASNMLDTALARLLPDASPLSDTYRLVFSMTGE